MFVCMYICMHMTLRIKCEYSEGSRDLKFVCECLRVYLCVCISIELKKGEKSQAVFKFIRFCMCI